MATTTDDQGNVYYGAPAASPPARSAREWPTLPKVSWAGVFAGVVVVLVVELMLDVLGLGIGASTIDPMRERNPVAGISTGAGIWLLASTLLALFAGGFVAGRLAGVMRHMDGALHGMLAWGLSSLLALYLLTTTIGGIVGGVGKALGSGLGAAGTGLGQAASGMQPGQVAETVREAKDLGTKLAQSNGNLNDADRNAAIDTLASRTGMSRDDATRTVAGIQDTFREAQQKTGQVKAQGEQKMREVGQRTAEGVASASLWAFFALLIGGISATLGGRIGAGRARRVALREIRA